MDFAAAFSVKKTESNRLGVFGKNRKVHAFAVPSRSQWVRLPRPNNEFGRFRQSYLRREMCLHRIRMRRQRAYRRPNASPELGTNLSLWMARARQYRVRTVITLRTLL